MATRAGRVGFKALPDTNTIFPGYQRAHDRVRHNIPQVGLMKCPIPITFRRDHARTRPGICIGCPIQPGSRSVMHWDAMIQRWDLTMHCEGANVLGTHGVFVSYDASGWRHSVGIALIMHWRPMTVKGIFLWSKSNLQRFDLKALICQRIHLHNFDKSKMTFWCQSFEDLRWLGDAKHIQIKAWLYLSFQWFWWFEHRNVFDSNQ